MNVDAINPSLGSRSWILDCTFCPPKKLFELLFTFIVRGRFALGRQGTKLGSPPFAMLTSYNFRRSGGKIQMISLTVKTIAKKTKSPIHWKPRFSIVRGFGFKKPSRKPKSRPRMSRLLCCCVRWVLSDAGLKCSLETKTLRKRFCKLCVVFTYCFLERLFEHRNTYALGMTPPVLFRFQKKIKPHVTQKAHNQNPGNFFFLQPNFSRNVDPRYLQSPFQINSLLSGRGGAACTLDESTRCVRPRDGVWTGERS